MRCRLDRQLLICGLLSLCIVLPRSLLISHAHNEYLDDEYHLDHGLSELRREHQPVTFNDPPLGEALIALPLYLAGCQVKIIHVNKGDGVQPFRTVLHEQPLDSETLLMLVAGWKALLFVPAVMVAFAWCRRIYGVRSAWLAAGLLLVDPNISGHLPVAALDALAMQGVIIAAYAAWRYIEEPTRFRLLAAGLTTAAAMLIKHTAIIMPFAVIVLAGLHWFVRPWRAGQAVSEVRRSLRPRLNGLAAGFLVILVSIWVLTLFDFSPPSARGTIFSVAYDRPLSLRDRFLEPALSVPWPAGIYLGSVLEAIQHAQQGHYGYLWGEYRFHGWWYYYFAVALYKVPVGIWLVLGLGAASLLWVRPRWEELSLLVPLVLCGMLIIFSGLNIGFRHALPTYGLLLLLASRSLASGGRGVTVAAWAGVLIALLHTLTFHPDYIAYTNGVFRRPYLAITDSNLDWGQSLKQVGRWLEKNRHPGQPVAIDSQIGDPALTRYVGPDVQQLWRTSPMPTRGLLIVSSTRLAGVYFHEQRYAHLREVEPTAMIGHSMLVYDLDRLAAQPTTRETH